MTSINDPDFVFGVVLIVIGLLGFVVMIDVWSINTGTILLFLSSCCLIFVGMMSALSTVKGE